MKVGTIFEHPTKDGGVVRLKAIADTYKCLGCVFNDNPQDCENDRIGHRNEEIAYNCARSGVIFVNASDKPNKLSRIMEAVRNNTESYGEEQDAILEGLISKILEE